MPDAEGTSPDAEEPSRLSACLRGVPAVRLPAATLQSGTVGALPKVSLPGQSGVVGNRRPFKSLALNLGAWPGVLYVAPLARDLENPHCER